MSAKPSKRQEPHQHDYRTTRVTYKEVRASRGGEPQLVEYHFQRCFGAQGGNIMKCDKPDNLVALR